MEASQLFENVLSAALAQVKAAGIPVFTFALYHDHESAAVSVCVDTEESSVRSVRATNQFNMRYFMKAVAAGDLADASLWQANIGRSLALGDFALVNAARTSIGSVSVNDEFYLAMVRALVAKQQQVSDLSTNPERLVFACSGPDDEVAYVWSMPASA
jgi:hypothetical protein